MGNLTRLSHIEGTKTAEMKRTLKFIENFKAKKEERRLQRGSSR